jgi:glycosyltransferase involved in cell wall biosynthesis
MLNLNKRVNFIGPVNPTGYGVHFCNLMYAIGGLLKDNVDKINIIDVNGTKCSDDNGLINCDRLKDRNSNPPFNTKKDVTVKLWHDHSLTTDLNTYNIGYTVFELDRFERPTQISDPSVNEIWVASKWAKDIVDKHLNNSKPVKVIPEGVCKATYKRYNLNKFVAKTAINVGKFEARKGHELLLEVWKNVEYPLHCLWHNPFVPPEAIIKRMAELGWIIGNTVYVTLYSRKVKFCQFWHKYGFTPIAVLFDRLTSQEYKIFLESASFGVFPYFAEGWNLPLIEAMANGLPCIATNYSGPTEYINKDNCLLLNNYKMQVARDGVFFDCKEAQWAVPDKDELLNAILVEIDNRASGITEHLFYNEFADKWDWHKAAEKVINRINEIEL